MKQLHHPLAPADLTTLGLALIYSIDNSLQWVAKDGPKPQSWAEQTNQPICRQTHGTIPLML